MKKVDLKAILNFIISFFKKLKKTSDITIIVKNNKGNINVYHNKSRH